MRRLKLFEYQIKKEKVELALDLINIYLDEIEINEPETNCRVFRKEDDVTFIHLIEFTDRTAAERHFAADYTTQFIESIKELCENKIVITDVEEI